MVTAEGTVEERHLLVDPSRHTKSQTHTRTGGPATFSENVLFSLVGSLNSTGK